MDIIDKQDYSNSNFYTQLLKLKAFRRDQTKFVNLPYYRKIEGCDKLFISKQIWIRYRKKANSPDVKDLILIAGYFKVRVEYFFITDAKPHDYITDKTSADNEFVIYEDKVKQKYSLDCFHVQLKKLRLFKGFKKQIAAVRHYKIQRLVWLTLERGDHRPDTDRLILFSNCFNVRIEYFVIPDAMPQDYLMNDDQVKNMSTPVGEQIGASQYYAIKNISVQLKKLRLFFEYKSQSSLYSQLKIDKQIWGMWESGKSKPKYENLFLLSSYLYIRIEYFFIAGAKPEDYINNESMISAIRLLAEAKNNAEPNYSIDSFHIQLEKTRLLYDYKIGLQIVSELKTTLNTWMSWLRNKKFPDFKNIIVLSNYFKVRVEYFFIKDAKPEEYIREPD